MAEFEAEHEAEHVDLTLLTRSNLREPGPIPNAESGRNPSEPAVLNLMELAAADKPWAGYVKDAL